MSRRTLVPPGRPAVLTREPVALPATQYSPQVKLWAALGAVSLVIVISGWTRWILSGPEQGPVGISLHGGLLVVLRSLECASVVSAVYVVWRFVVKPWRRDGALSLDGMIVIAVGTMWFYDPLVNYFNFTVGYNTNFFNVGTWANYIPGWQTPNGQFWPEPLLAIGGCYVWFNFGAVVVGCAILRKLKARYPSMTTLGLFSVLTVVMVIGEFLCELGAIALKVWVFVGSPDGLTLWRGTPHQVPIYESILAGLWIAGTTAVRYLKDDHGRSFVESGVERLGGSNKTRKLASFLAVTGFCHACVLGLYFVPYNWFALQADTSPALPASQRDGICGAGTAYACPSEYVPIPHGKSLHVSPEDPRLPAWVRDRQDAP